MHSVKLIIFIALICYHSITGLYGQSKSLADQPVRKYELSGKSVSEADFISYFNINLEEHESYTVIDDVDMLTRPVMNADKSGIFIPEGSQLEVYDYYPKYAIFATCYQGEWGFIPATSIRPMDDTFHSGSLSDSVQPPRLLSELTVGYPKKALQKELHGSVILRLLISKTGAVKNCVIDAGIPGLDSTAVALTQNLRFKPARYMGKPVECWIRFPVTFKIPR